MGGAGTVPPADGTPRPDAALDHLISDTRDRLRAPWAAGIAGLVFAALFVIALLLLRTVPIYGAGDQAIADWFSSGGDTAIVVGALYCIPFAGVMFLWFVAVIRDQIGDREDQFFATAFFGSGLLFVALLSTSAALLGMPIVSLFSDATINLGDSADNSLRVMGHQFERNASGEFIVPFFFTLLLFLLGLLLATCTLWLARGLGWVYGHVVQAIQVARPRAVLVRPVERPTAPHSAEGGTP